MGDWVVQPETWMPTDYLAGGPSEVVFHEDQMGSTIRSSFPLTSWHEIAFASEQYRLPDEGSMTAVQTRGHIHWIVGPAAGVSWASMFSQDWCATWKFRIGVAMSEPGETTTQVPGVQYNLFNPSSANDEFVWERDLMTVNISQDEWNGAAASRCRFYGTIPVVAKYRRILQPPEVMAIHFQAGQSNLVGSLFEDQTNRLRFAFRYQLRTYVTTSG